MKKKRFLGIIMTIIFVLSCSSSVLANGTSKTKMLTGSKKLPGIIHEDGSYQFADEELERLNEYIKASDDVYTLSSAIAYAAPEFYTSLTKEAQDVLETASFQSSNSQVGTRAHASHDFAFLGGCTTQISRYGNSIKGVATIDRQTATQVPAEVDGYYVVNQIYNDQNYRVGYSVNVSMEAHVSATTIIDPPSGSYVSEGLFEIPYNCPTCFNWTRASARAEHGPISYYNPYA